MPAVNKLTETVRNTLLTLPIEINESGPFTVPAKPLSTSRLAIVTSAGLHLRDDRPFTAGDPSYRVIPSNTPAANLVQSHTSIGFDRTGVLEDINVVFPIERLHEMVAAGRIGELAPVFYSSPICYSALRSMLCYLHQLDRSARTRSVFSHGFLNKRAS